MSHNTMVKNVKITNLDCLRMAIAELQKEGVQVRLNETSGTFRTYSGQPNKCDLTIELPKEPWDVGLVKQPDGTYVPVFDEMLYNNSTLSCPYVPGDQRDNRNAIAMLVQRYAIVTTEHEAELEGHSCTRQQGKNGEVQVLVEVAA